ncbi:MAG: trypsin-like peptidase domain-containing protein, partial [Planctomycetales bacterium]
MNESRSQPTQLPLTSVTMFLLLVVSVTVLAPYIAEQIQYALVRGEQRAKSDLAKTQLAKLSDSSEAFRLVAQRVGPAVVYIQASVPVDDVDDSLHGAAAPLLSRGQGSGVIIDAAGYVLTNHHVVRDARRIQVKLSDGRKTTGKLVGSDPLTDLAVLKIDVGTLVAADWGDSDAMEVGDWVLALGSPFGLEHSVTAGIVSAKGRGRVVDSIDYQDFLQTDAAVNPGNSGGPLVNLKGEVVGVNTAIVGEVYRGVSFAIPSAIARDVFERLKKDGEVRRAFLGVGLADLTPEIAELRRLKGRQGAVVTHVLEATPAAKAGMAPGDLVIAWNGKAVSGSNDLRFKVARTPIYSSAEVVVIRKLSLEGNSLSPLEFTDEEDRKGAVITRVPTKAADALDSGDRIIRWNDEPVENAHGLRGKLDEPP